MAFWEVILILVILVIIRWLNNLVKEYHPEEKKPEVVAFFNHSGFHHSVFGKSNKKFF